MAIKGKGKTKTKTVARGPRPAPVKVKPAFFLRRWVQVSLALVAGIGVMLIAVWVTNGLREQRLDKEATARDARVQKAAREWLSTVETTMTPLGQQPQQDVQLFPEMNAAIDSLSKGMPVKGAAIIAEAAKKAADKAATDLSAIKLSEVIRDKGFDLATTNYMLNSQARMVHGLNLYAKVASLLTLATNERDPDRQAALLTEAKDLAGLAATIYREGYSDYSQAMQYAGLAGPTIPGG